MVNKNGDTIASEAIKPDWLKEVLLFRLNPKASKWQVNRPSRGFSKTIFRVTNVYRVLRVKDKKAQVSSVVNDGRYVLDFLEYDAPTDKTRQLQRLCLDLDILIGLIWPLEGELAKVLYE